MTKINKDRVKKALLRDLEKQRFPKERLIEMYAESFGYRYYAFFKNVVEEFTEKEGQKQRTSKYKRGAELKMNKTKTVVRTYEEYLKLMRIREYARQLDYQIIAQIIDDEEEIMNLNNRFKDWGLTEREINNKVEREELVEDFERDLIDTVKRALNVASDIYIQEVLQTYQANCGDIVFEVVTEESTIVVGTIGTISPLSYMSIDKLVETNDAKESKQIFLDEIIKYNS